MTKTKTTTLAEWIDNSTIHGRLFFSLNEVIEAFPDISKNSLMTSINRQISRGNIQSLWRGFYGILVYEYKLRKTIPVSDYIDILMQHLGRYYYVALLTAAALQGAAHQVPQTFMVMVKGGSLRAREKNGVRIRFFTRTEVPKGYIENVMTKTGHMAVSTPELTAIDLVARMKDIGGVSRAAEVLEELSDVLDFTKVNDDYFSLVPVSAVQRLGHLLDVELDNSKLADALYERAVRAGIHFRPFLLVPEDDITTDGLPKRHGRWKIVPNKEVEIS
jgi:predicted transcriptional regulator of viral defense system